MSTNRYTLQKSNRVAVSFSRKNAEADDLSKWVTGISVGYFMLMLCLWFLISVYSEEWWLSAVFVYLPRLLYLFPVLILLGLSFYSCRKWTILNLVTIVVILGPLMNCSMPLQQLFATPVEGTTLRIVSCNVQRYKPRFADVLQEIAWSKPDIVALQEAPDNPPMVDQYFKDWYTVEVDEYWVGSKYPLKIISTCKTAAFDRISAVAVEVTLPEEKIMLFNIHQTTARAGLTELDVVSLLTGAGQNYLENYIYLRTDEAMATREFIEGLKPNSARIIAGDFNAPSQSSVYQNAWGDLQNCFNTAGWGYGYTSPVKKHRLWLDNTPWLKIDHILVGKRWAVNKASVGNTKGSDHHLVRTELVLKQETSSMQSQYSYAPDFETETATQKQLF